MHWRHMFNRSDVGVILSRMCSHAISVSLIVILLNIWIDGEISFVMVCSTILHIVYGIDLL